MTWPSLLLEQLALPERSAIKIGPFGSQLKRTKLASEGIHVIGIENVLKRQFDGLGDRYVTEEKFRTLQSFEVIPGDVLVTMMGTVGQVAIVPHGTGRSLMDSHLLRFRPNAKLCTSEFVAWVIRSPTLRSAIDSRAHGAIMQGLNSGIIRSLPVALPPLSEQRRIVEVLDQADVVRNLRVEADAIAERIAPALFIDMFGDPVENPKGWETSPFGELLTDKPRNGVSPAADGRIPARVLTLSAITGNRFDERAVKDGLFARRPGEDKMVDERDFLICRGNGNLGLVGRAHFPRRSLSTTVFPDTIIAARPNQNRLGRTYLECLWHIRSFRSRVERRAQTTSGIYKVNQRIIEELLIPLPPIDLQHKFGQIAAIAVDVASTEASAVIERLFATLLADAFSGGLTAQWREAHVTELLSEMEQQSRALSQLSELEAHA